LSPWVLIWLGTLTGLVKLKQPLTSRHKKLFGVAAVSGLLLIIISQSGQSIATLLMATIIIGIWLFRTQGTRTALLKMTAVTMIALPLAVWLAVMSVGERFGGARIGNSSWDE